LAKIAENRDHIIDPRKSRLEISAKCKTTWLNDLNAVVHNGRC
jgi:hypothetical protein